MDDCGDCEAEITKAAGQMNVRNDHIVYIPRTELDFTRCFRGNAFTNVQDIRWVWTAISSYAKLSASTHLFVEIPANHSRGFYCSAPWTDISSSSCIWSLVSYCLALSGTLGDRKSSECNSPIEHCINATSKQESKLITNDKLLIS